MRLKNASAHVDRQQCMIGLHSILGDSGMLAYLAYMAERLTEIRRVVKPTGSVYLHCDPNASHYLKVVMDAIFGGRNFIPGELVLDPFCGCGTTVVAADGIG